MATEEQKQGNFIRALSVLIVGLAKGLYELFGESAYAVMHPVGDHLLDVMQREMGLEIGGASTKEIASEIARLFVDEFAFAEEIKIVEADDNHVVVHTKNCLGYNLTKSLQEAGVKYPFTCPIMNVMASGIKQVTGKEVHRSAEWKPERRGTDITLRLAE